VTTISSLWLMILIEMLVVTTLATIVLVIIKFIRDGRDRAVAKSLINKIKDDGARRKEETKKLMLKKFGFAEEEAEEIAQKSAREERKFYQNVINFYLRRDAVVFENLNIDFEGAVDPYRNLNPPGIGGSTGADIEAVDESEEIRRLKIENKRLTDEVGVTMDTMSRMLDEYSSMFAGGPSDENDKEETIKQPQNTVEDEQVVATEEAESEQDADTTAESESVGNGDIFAEPEPEDDENLVADSESGFEADVTGVLDEEAEQEVGSTTTDQGEVAAERLPEEDSMDEEMDDLSDLEPFKDDDIHPDDELENPDELIG